MPKETFLVSAGEEASSRAVDLRGEPGLATAAQARGELSTLLAHVHRWSELYRKREQVSRRDVENMVCVFRRLGDWCCFLGRLAQSNHREIEAIARKREQTSPKDLGDMVPVFRRVGNLSRLVGGLIRTGPRENEAIDAARRARRDRKENEAIVRCAVGRAGDVLGAEAARRGLRTSSVAVSRGVGLLLKGKLLDRYMKAMRSGAGWYQDVQAWPRDLFWKRGWAKVPKQERETLTGLEDALVELGNAPDAEDRGPSADVALAAEPAGARPKGPDRPRRGAPVTTDERADRKMLQAWKSGAYPRYADLALELDCKPREVELALQRQRGRDLRRARAGDML